MKHWIKTFAEILQTINLVLEILQTTNLVLEILRTTNLVLEILKIVLVICPIINLESELEVYQTTKEYQSLCIKTPLKELEDGALNITIMKQVSCRWDGDFKNLSKNFLKEMNCLCGVNFLSHLNSYGLLYWGKLILNCIVKGGGTVSHVNIYQYWFEIRNQLVAYSEWVWIVYFFLIFMDLNFDAIFLIFIRTSSFCIVRASLKPIHSYSYIQS